MWYISRNCFIISLQILAIYSKFTVKYMDSVIINKVEKGLLRKRPEVTVGDNVKVSFLIKEGAKERVQVFEGIVIALKGSGLTRTMTVRKISYGIGVEKIVPLHSPIVQKIEVVKRTRVNRAKLYYMRDKVGKQAMKVGLGEEIYLTDEVEKVEEPKVENSELKEETKKEEKEVAKAEVKAEVKVEDKKDPDAQGKDNTKTEESSK